MVKKEDREQVLFNKISDAMLPVFVQYGRSIIREAMTLPETHLTIQRNYPKFTPAIEKYREVLLTDSRLIKCIRNLEQLDFFNKNKGKYLLLEHFIFQVTPINLMLLLLEYVLVNQEASLIRLRSQREVFGKEPIDYEIDDLNMKVLSHTIDLFKKLIFTTVVEYEVNSTFYGLRGNFKNVTIGEYVLTPKKIPLKVDSSDKPSEIRLVNLKKTISLPLENLFFNTSQEAAESKRLSFIGKDPANEFAEFMGFMMGFFESTGRDFILVNVDRYRGTYIGSIGTFIGKKADIDTLSTRYGLTQGVALSSVLKGVVELEEEHWQSFRTVWDTFFDSHIRKSDNVCTALRRLGKSSIRLDPEDKLIDLIVGFESLIGIKPKEKSIGDAIGVRASILIEKNQNAFDLITKAYRLRNAIMHSGKLQIKEEELEQVNRSLTQLLGYGIYDYVRLYKKSNFSDESQLVKYLDDALLQSTHKLIREPGNPEEV